jgi:hypothetical protein
VARLIVTMLVLCGTSMPAAAACPASAIVEGDAPVVATVRSELARRGVTEPEDPSCATTRAWVTQEGGQFRVKVQDAAGRESERVVSDETSVAILVESWVRPELTTWTPPAPISGSQRMPSVYVAARGELGLDVTGEPAYGASAEVSRPVRAYRLGVLVRASSSPEFAGPEGIEASRLGVDVLVDAARVAHLGRLIVTPGIAVGAGWLSTTGSLQTADGASISSYGLRTRLHLGIALPIAQRWAIELLMAGDLAPFAHIDTYMPVTVKSLPGEAWLTASAGVGLVMEVP